MKKKVLICLAFVIVLIPIILIASFLSSLFLEGRTTFKNQEKAAIDFVKENYEESFELIDSRNVNFNAGFSEFYFYNQEDNFYFSVSVDSITTQGIYEVYDSDYEEQKNGNLISKEIKEKFNDLDFIISTYYNNNEGYGHTYIKLLQDGSVDDEKEYSFLKYIVDNYDNMNIEYFLLEEKEYKFFKNKPLNEIRANAGFNYKSHIDIIYGDVYHWIKDASEFDYEMYLKLKKFDEYLNDNSGSVINPFE